jgi:hypothetical protein
MRADSGPLAIFAEGARRLVRAPLPLAAFLLAVVIGTYAIGDPQPFAYIDLSRGFDARSIIGKALWLMVSSFLLGGVLARYAYPDRTGMSFFLGSGRAFFGRMMRITVTGAVAAYGLQLLSAPDRPPENDVVAEGFAAFLASTAAGCFVHACVALTEIRVVAEDRRSTLFALVAGLRLLAARPWTMLAIYATAGFLLLTAVFFLVLVPAVAGAQDEGWAGALWGQSFAVALMLFDLLISASLVVLYQVEMVRQRPEPAPAEASSSGLSGLNALTAKE